MAQRFNNSAFIGPLSFVVDYTKESLGTENCTGYRDAFQHAVHLTREYGVTVLIQNSEGKTLKEVIET